MKILAYYWLLTAFIDLLLGSLITSYTSSIMFVIAAVACLIIHQGIQDLLEGLEKLHVNKP